MVKNILVADDDANIRNMLATYLKGEGYNVALAKNGQEAVEMATFIDLALMDVAMPVVTGLEAVKQLRKKKHHFPVYFVTGNKNMEAVHRAINQGLVQGVIGKPFKLDQIAIILEQAKRDIQMYRKLADELKSVSDRVAQIDSSAREYIEHHKIENRQTMKRMQSLLGDLEKMIYGDRQDPESMGLKDHMSQFRAFQTKAEPVVDKFKERESFDDRFFDRMKQWSMVLVLIMTAISFVAWLAVRITVVDFMKSESAARQQSERSSAQPTEVFSPVPIDGLSEDLTEKEQP